MENKIMLIQEKINERAEKLLRKDLKKTLPDLFGHRTTVKLIVLKRDNVTKAFINSAKATFIEDIYEIETNEKETSITVKLTQNSYDILKAVNNAMFNKRIDKFIEKTTEEYINSIDELKERITELENQII